MGRFFKSYGVELSIIAIFGAFFLLLTSGIPMILTFHEWASSVGERIAPDLHNLFTIFLSIFVEGLPFILLGVLLSALIHQYVNQETIWRFVPKNPLLSIPLATCLGLVLPICECGIIPVTRRFIQKGLPPYFAFTFLLAAPIINPITIGSTYLAFNNDWIFTFQRIGFGAFVSMVMGVGFFLFFKNKPVLKVQNNDSCSDGTCHHDHHHGHEKNHDTKGFGSTLYHAIFEFIEMGKYFVLGALIAAAFHVFVGVSAIKYITDYEGIAILLLMAFAFGMSICSSADAFIAASFRQVISNAPILAFLVYGPMMDIKNVFMFMGSFRPSVVGFFFVGTTLLTFLSILIFFI